MLFADKQIIRLQETPDEIPQEGTPHNVSLLMHDKLVDVGKPGDRVETTREGAEKAAKELSNKLVIKGLQLKLMWGKPQASKLESENQDALAAVQGMVAHTGMLPRPIVLQQQIQNLQTPPGTWDQPPIHYFNIPAPALTEPTL
ncbi:DNA replication licensing factor, mcm4 component [Asimina triloba]